MEKVNDMKRMMLAALAAMAVCIVAAAAPKFQKTVVFKTSMDCAHCVKKITENVSFERGVKNLSTDLSQKTVTVSFDPAKTDTLKLANSLRKLGYTAKVVEFK